MTAPARPRPATFVPGDDQVAVLKALAHPIRLGIVLRLAAEPGICACDFTEHFAVSQPTISSHLRVLRDAGVVHTRRRGTTICYQLAPRALGELATLIDGLAAATEAG